MPNTLPDADTLAPFFSLPAKPARKVRPLVAVWPCGTRWTIESAARGEWSAPVYRDGEQTGVDIMADTRAELLAELESEGATIEREGEAAPAITLTAESSDRATANWSDGSARFHVWIVRRAGGWTIESTIYKNPPLASDGKPMRTDAPGYFDTRQLDLDAKANAATAARIRELATPEALESLTTAYTTERDRRTAWEARARRVAYLAQCVAALQDAKADDLAEAMIDADPDTAARAEMLRTAGKAGAAPTHCICGRPAPCRLCLPLDPSGAESGSAPSVRVAEIRAAARVLQSASPEEMQAAAPPANAERTDESGRRYIDMTPSWAGVLPVYMAALTDGNAKGQAAARTELQRMAKAADSAVQIAAIAKA